MSRNEAGWKEGEWMKVKMKHRELDNINEKLHKLLTEKKNTKNLFFDMQINWKVESECDVDGGICS